MEHAIQCGATTSIGHHTYSWSSLCNSAAPFTPLAILPVMNTDRERTSATATLRWQRRSSARRAEKHAILTTLDTLKGDKLMAAKVLGIGKTTLYRKLKQYGIGEHPAMPKDNPLPSSGEPFPGESRGVAGSPLARSVVKPGADSRVLECQQFRTRTTTRNTNDPTYEPGTPATRAARCSSTHHSGRTGIWAWPLELPESSWPVLAFCSADALHGQLAVIPFSFLFHGTILRVAAVRAGGAVFPRVRPSV